MSVTEVKLLSVGAGSSVEGSDTTALTISYTSTYMAKCSDPADDPTVVLSHFRNRTSLPWIGRTYRFGNGFNTAALCRSIRPSYVEKSNGIYLVHCEFRNADPQDNQQQQPTLNGNDSADPFQWFPEISVSSGSLSLPIEFATFLGTNGNRSRFMTEKKFLPVTNSALEPMDPTFEEEFSYKIIRFAKNYRAYDDAFWNKYNDAINRSEFTINRPQLGFRTTVARHYGKLKVNASLNFAKINNRQVPYWRRELELQIRGWDRAILDQGSRELLEPGDTKPDGKVVSAGDCPRGRSTLEIPITDDDGLPIDKPRLLDGAGKRLKEGRPPVLLGWQTFEEQDFSQIDW